MAAEQLQRQNPYEATETLLMDITDNVLASNESRELSGEYHVVGRCGTGGCAVVEEGYRLSDNKHVAIKILSLPAGLEHDEAERTRLRFYREARLMASMKSPYIVECVDYGLFQGRPCMILEFMDGIQLDDYLKQNGAMPFEQAIDITCQVLMGLGVAHSMGVIHRDIKPANIMVLNNTQKTGIRVYDFGIATVLDDAPGDLMRTQVGSIRGTPSYMAPELFSGEVRACPATDIYAVGLMLYECLIGTVAVMGTSLIQISYKQMHEPLDIPIFIPECLANVIHKCCAKKVNERYQTTDEVVEALKEVLPEATKQRISCEARYLEAIREKGTKSTKGENDGKLELSRPVIIAIAAGFVLCVGLIIFLIAIDFGGESEPVQQPFSDEIFGQPDVAPEQPAPAEEVPNHDETAKAPDDTLNEGENNNGNTEVQGEAEQADANQNVADQNKANTEQPATDSRTDKKRRHNRNTNRQTTGRIKKDTTAIPNFK